MKVLKMILHKKPKKIKILKRNVFETVSKLFIAAIKPPTPPAVIISLPT